jgi:hypothetical protein
MCVVANNIEDHFNQAGVENWAWGAGFPASVRASLSVQNALPSFICYCDLHGFGVFHPDHRSISAG